MASSRAPVTSVKGSVEIVRDRLYWVSVHSRPRDTATMHFFSIDDIFTYWNFYLDFGPLNLGQLFRFCQIMSKKLRDPGLAGKQIYLYSGPDSGKRANSATLIAAYSMLYLGRTPAEAHKPFVGVYPPFPSFHDASPCVCTYILTVRDVLDGIYKALQCGFFDFDDFKIEEVEHYEKVEYGDLNWIVKGRFLAFAGPHDVRSSSPEGYYTLCPEDYIPYFKKRGVQRVVRLNKKYYDERRFLGTGFKHTDLYYLDGSNPPEKVLRTFLETCERTDGAIAVHCKAGLGRTGSCIGAYLMKHYGFTAKEVIGWLRVCRPGSVIGPQQQYLQGLQDRMWREGKAYRLAHGAPLSGVHALRSPWEALDRPKEEEGGAEGSEKAAGAGAGGARGAASGAGGGGGRTGASPAARTLASSPSHSSSARGGGRPGAIGIGSKTAPRMRGTSAASVASRGDSGGSGAATGSFGSTSMLDAPGTPASVASDASQGDFLRSAKGRLAGGGGTPGLGSSFGRSPLATSSRRTLAAGGGAAGGGGGR